MRNVETIYCNSSVTFRKLIWRVSLLLILAIRPFILGAFTGIPESIEIPLTLWIATLFASLLAVYLAGGPGIYLFRLCEVLLLIPTGIGSAIWSPYRSFSSTWSSYLWLIHFEKLPELHLPVWVPAIYLLFYITTFAFRRSKPPFAIDKPELRISLQDCHFVILEAALCSLSLSLVPTMGWYNYISVLIGECTTATGAVADLMIPGLYGVVASLLSRDIVLNGYRARVGINIVVIIILATLIECIAELFVFHMILPGIKDIVLVLGKLAFIVGGVTTVTYVEGMNRLR